MIYLIGLIAFIYLLSRVHRSENRAAQLADYYARQAEAARRLEESDRTLY